MDEDYVPDWLKPWGIPPLPSYSHPDAFKQEEPGPSLGDILQQALEKQAEADFAKVKMIAQASDLLMDSQLRMVLLECLELGGSSCQPDSMWSVWCHGLAKAGLVVRVAEAEGTETWEATDLAKEWLA